MLIFLWSYQFINTSLPTALSVSTWRQAKALPLTFVLFEHCATITGSKNEVFSNCYLYSVKVFHNCRLLVFFINTKFLLRQSSVLGPMLTKWASSWLLLLALSSSLMWSRMSISSAQVVPLMRVEGSGTTGDSCLTQGWQIALPNCCHLLL